MPPKKIIIIGAGGRDFHNYNVVYRGNRSCKVVAFTAAQIPNIDDRRYPASLAGPGYPSGIPVYPEMELSALIQEHKVDEAVFAYSDVSFDHVMTLASKVMAAGADFKLLGPRETMLRSEKPVISVCAVRTGCGKSQTSRKVASIVRELGLKVAVVRHPMPYGDLTRQVCQRFETIGDLGRHNCTIEEREEYEAHIQEGHLVFAGVDYGMILRAAESEADVILWDGGNNDFPFFSPDLHIVVTDPHRCGHELAYHPGLTNLLMADVALINKVDTADRAATKQVRANIKAVNPRAIILESASPIQIDSDGYKMAGKRILAIEDGPTVTHGGMGYGAAFIAAKKAKAGAIVDPRPFAKGSYKKVFSDYKHLKSVLPAVGYGKAQIQELERTINSIPCDFVFLGTPMDLRRLLSINKPLVRVTYAFAQKSGKPLEEIVKQCLRSKKKKKPLTI